MKRTSRWRRVVWCVGAAPAVIAVLVIDARLALHLVPLPRGLFTNAANQIEIVDRNGASLRVVRAGEQPYLQAIEYSRIPQQLVHATLAAEDGRFWRHPGVDWRATLRAGWQWLRHQRVVSGGSTITQQLIKLAEARPRTLRTKFVEALQALRLEQVWSKQRIMAAYLNRIDYGNLNSGCCAAAQFYFVKPLADLTAAECAFLAALPQAPTRLNPHVHFERAHKRQRWILNQMHERGWLSSEEFQRATEERLCLAPRRRAFEAPHFIDLILDQDWSLVYGAKQAGTIRPVRTTLDLTLNRFAEQTLRRHVERLRGQHVSNGAVVILDNRNGEVLSLVGSVDYSGPDAGQVNGAWARRSAGSTFKPFTYLLALEQGGTPASIVADVPTEFATKTGVFAPVNYNHHCYGPMRYRPALANSLNISAVKVLSSIGGPEPLQRLLQNCGLTSLDRSADEYGLGLTIGNAEARLLELANAYACLGRLGEYIPIHLLRDSIVEHPRRVADQGAAFLIADMLSDNDARTLAFGAESPLRFEFPVACKTGTSSDFRDNWAFGFTPEFTVGVWVGNFDGTPMSNVSGVTGAAPILHDLFEHLHEQYGTSWYEQPASIVGCLVHPITGKRLKINGRTSTDETITEKFLSSNLPPYESATDYAVGASTTKGRLPVFLGTEYKDWASTSDNNLGASVTVAAAEASVRIVFPLPGTTVYLDPDLPGGGRRLPLQALGPAEVQWESTSLPIVSYAGRATAVLSEGRHELIATDRLRATEARTWVNVIQR